MELPALDCYGAPLRELDRSGRGRRRARRPVGAARARAEGVARPVRAAVRRRRRGRRRVRPARTTRRSRAKPRRSRSCCCENDGDCSRSHPTRAIAVIGPAADDERLLQGDYSYPAHTEIAASRATGDGRHPPAGRRRVRARARTSPSRVTPLAGMRARFAPTSTYAKGCERAGHDDRPTSTRPSPIARDADVVVCCVGGRSGLHARLHERRVPRRERPRPPRRAATARRSAWSRRARRSVVVVVSGRVHALPWIAERVRRARVRVVPGRAGWRRARRRAVRRRRRDRAGLPITVPRSVGPDPDRTTTIAPAAAAARCSATTSTRPRRRSTRSATASRTRRSRTPTCDVERRRRPRAVRGAGATCATPGDRAGTEVVQCYLRDEVARVARPAPTARRLRARRPRARRSDRDRRVHASTRPQLAYYDEDDAPRDRARRGARDGRRPRARDRR